MLDRPTPDELLDAVSSFLREQVVPGTSGALAYQARVAANALAIVRRQHALEAAASQREHDALVRLLGADPAADVEQLNRVLCDRLAGGEVGLDTPGLVDALWRVTLDKLAIDQPGYDTYVRHRAATDAEER